MSPIEESPHTRNLRRFIVTVTAVGAAAIALVAPAAGDLRAYTTHWGDGAPEAATLTAVTATVIAVAAIALVVGPSLRASRAPLPTRQQAQRRFWGFVVSVVLGVVFYSFYVLASLR